jgi:hypothetical protein
MVVMGWPLTYSASSSSIALWKAQVVLPGDPLQRHDVVGSVASWRGRLAACEQLALCGEVNDTDMRLILPGLVGLTGEPERFDPRYAALIAGASPITSGHRSDHLEKELLSPKIRGQLCRPIKNVAKACAT